MVTLRSERYLFSLLSPYLLLDLVSNHGFRTQDAEGILNWFSPSGPEYLTHVDDWQKLLCAGSVEEPNACTEMPPVLTYERDGSVSLRNVPAHQVYAIHQVAKLFYKFHGIPRRKTDWDAVVTRLSQPLPITLDESELSGIRECLSGIKPPDLDSVIGRFGPGATCERFNAYEKWSRRGPIPDLPPSFFRVNPRDPWVPSGTNAFRYTRISEVPKSIKCNRIVSSEPAMSMFAQLAVNDDLCDQIHRLFRGHVSLDDQERHNHFLQRRGACSIDLSDASDHVSVDLVASVLPQLWPVLAKVRSQFTQLPDGRIIRLATFAPMGSGVCFSVMTTVILGIIRYAFWAYGRYTSCDRWYSVYGDDIIVPAWIYDIVLDLLTRAGLVVNTAKSACWGGYRESCGCELFGDEDITPCYIRDDFDALPATKVEQVCEHLDVRGFPRTAHCVASQTRCVVAIRHNQSLQRREVCVRTLSSRSKIRSLDGWDGLNRWFALGTQAKSWDASKPEGVCAEVWTKKAYRYRDELLYPYLTHWFVTSAKRTNDTRDNA